MNFRDAHNAYHATLDNDFEIQDSQEYFKCENQRIVNFQRTLKEWFSRVESEINPHDSVSNTGSRSCTRTSRSKSSHTSLRSSEGGSSAASPRTIAAAKRALLTAALRQQQNLQEEELRLKQQQEKARLRLEQRSNNSRSIRKLLRWRLKRKSTLWLNKEAITCDSHPLCRHRTSHHSRLQFSHAHQHFMP